ncbi:hypothetical protein GGH13_004978 [Coemansia sp. S155-1]|nr:hypothetical protein H4S03_006634 [Coemansia sp. S3946]KAJ2068264.1 hypothetical protein GGH13_004978 [Coemansia sp. S155-1]
MNSNRNNMPVVPAASRTESVILAAAQELDGKNRTIAELERANLMQQDTIDRLEHTLTERDEKITQLEHTISKQQHALDEQERTIARSSGHAHRIEHHLRQAVTIAGLIVEAPNGAATDNGAAPRNTNTDDDTRDGADPDDNDALDDADPNDDYVLDSDDAQENGNIQDNDDTQDSADPDDDDAPANQVTDSPPVAKRPRVDRQVRDGSEQVLANKDLLEVVGPIIFIDVDVLAGLYELVKNRQLIPAGVEARAFARRLEGLESFTRWKPRFSAVESATHTDLNVICRSNRELDSLRPKVLRQLGLAKNSEAAVVGSRLCYVLTTLDGLPPEKMTNSVMEKMFRMIVRKSLRTLRVVTRNGTRRMEIDELRNLAKVWINNICDLIAKEGIERSLELVTRCNNSYKRKCIERGAVDDLDGTVAMEMLVKDGLKSNLLLGFNHEHDLGALYTRFVPTAGNDNDESQADRL